VGLEVYLFINFLYFEVHEIDLFGGLCLGHPPNSGRNAIKGWISEGVRPGVWNHAVQVVNSAYSAVGCGMATAPVRILCFYLKRNGF
jgi:hypothetical protein